VKYKACFDLFKNLKIMIGFPVFQNELFHGNNITKLFRNMKNYV
jgi:hypothetical protein